MKQLLLLLGNYYNKINHIYNLWNEVNNKFDK